MSCTCNIPSTQTLTCFNCRSSWVVEMAQYERVSKCRIHMTQISISGIMPSLCGECTDDGYYIKRDGNGFFANITLMKNE